MNSEYLIPPTLRFITSLKDVLTLERVNRYLETYLPPFDSIPSILTPLTLSETL